MDKPTCDCGNPDAHWHGDTMRVYVCDRCWLRVKTMWKVVQDSDEENERMERG